METHITIHTAAGGVLSVPVADAATCAQAVYTSGLVPAPALCSGLGRCGLCAMKFLSEPPPPAPEDELVLSPEDLRAGWRLGCRHAPAPGMVLRVPPPPRRVRSTARLRETQECFLALDLGTTSLHWRALGTEGETPLAQGAELNPQMGAGSEVMSRLAHAARPENALRLRLLVLERIHELARELASAGAMVREICVAGNTVMTCLLLGKPLAGVSRAPYKLDYAGGERTSLTQGLDDPGPLRDLPAAYVPPLLAPFVGGDITAGLVALRFGIADGPEYPYLLADFGTNGEFALMLDEERVLAASVALGPAIEGIGLTCGTVARPGAVVGFELTPLGLTARQLPQDEDDTAADRRGDVGITGAGYLSLLQRLRTAGFVDEDGRFAPANMPGLPPLARKLALRTEEADGRLPLELQQGRAWLLPADVEEILKVKAACNVALSRLLREAGLEVHQLTAICLAGALGEHVGVANLEGLGFIPPGSGGRVRLLGNSSLEGAALLLDPVHGETRRQWAVRLAQGVRVLDLAQAEDFSDAFFKRMIFSYVP